jgi:hypothetical protein
MTRASVEPAGPGESASRGEPPSPDAGSDPQLAQPGSATPPGDAYERQESEAARLDRNFEELLQELRVAQTGVQILFAFLLGVAFTRPFQDSDQVAHLVFAVTLVLCAVATALLIGPVAVHRLVFRRRRKASLVRVGSVLATAGLFVLASAFAGALLLALDAVLARSTAVVVTAGVAAIFVLLWVVLPFLVRQGWLAQGRSSPPTNPAREH